MHETMGYERSGIPGNLRLSGKVRSGLPSGFNRMILLIVAVTGVPGTPSLTLPAA